MPERQTWALVRRLIRVTTTVVAILLACVVVVAAMYEQIGRSVDIGGRSLNIFCTGEGGPTVVFISGATAPGYVWTPSQRGVAAFTRACWYDRATIGWSD